MRALVPNADSCPEGCYPFGILKATHLVLLRILLHARDALTNIAFLQCYGSCQETHCLRPNTMCSG